MGMCRQHDTGGGRIWGCVDGMTQGEGGYGDVWTV